MASDSPFKHVFNTNYAPNDAEIDQIKALSVLPEREIDKIDQEIQHHQAIIDSLIQQRNKHQQSLDCYRALLSPMRRLSAELLQQIFVWCLPSSRNPMMHHSDAPVLLGRVCSQWRRIAYATAELWSAIHIVIPSVDNSPMGPPRRAAVRAWLSRAGDLPLSISVYAHYPVGEIELMLCEVIPFSQQWHTICMDIPEIGALNLCSIVSGNVPMLRHVRFKLLACHHRRRTGPWRQATDPNDNDVKVIMRFLMLHPNLEHFNLRIGPTIGWFTDLGLPPRVMHTSLSSLSIDFQNSFHVQDPSQQILGLLAVLPNLKRCTVSCSRASFPTPLPGQAATNTRQGPVNLEQLEALSLRDLTNYAGTPPAQHISIFCDVLDNLFTPSLTAVEFGVQNDEVASFRSLFTSTMNLLSRTLSSLSKLSIRRDAGILKETIKECIVQCPDLKELVIERMDTWPYRSNDDESDDEEEDSSRIGDKILNTLSDDMLCPKLESLTLVRFPPPHIDHSTILEFLKKRSRIKEFRLVPLHPQSTWDPTWQPSAKPVKEDPEYTSEFLKQLDEFKSSSEMQISLGDSQSTNSWRRSSPWIGFEDLEV